MPFKSEKQRKYLWANEPEIARDWTDKYGSRVKKVNGGVMDLINKYIGPSEGHMYDWGKALGAKNKPWSTTPEYHQWGAENLATHAAENWNNLFPGLGEAFKRTAPFIAGAASPIYDIPQGIGRYHDKPWEYETNNKWDKINAYFPDLQGTTASGILNAIDKEDPLSAAYNRMIGAAQPWIKDKFINRPNQIQELFGKGWDAIKNEFSGRVDAAEMPRQINKFGKTIGPLANTVTREEKESGLAPNWSMRDDLEAQNIRPTFDTSDEEQDYYNQIRNKIGRMPTIKDPNIFQRFRNRFYKPATSPAGGYNVSQLNRMNALGGYYSGPARQQRQIQQRGINVLNRAAAGKPVGNVNQLLGQYGYKKSPSGGVTFTGGHEGSSTAGAGYSRSDSGWQSSPFRKGGLATLWQR